MSDIVERLLDLHKQATEERSHYYTGKCIRDSIREIERLREALDWALNYIADGLEQPKHDCEYFSNPEKGSCDFHDRYWQARAALAQSTQGETHE